MTYAAATTVPFERSVADIVTTIKRAGAQQIGQMDDPAFFAIQFTLGERMIRFRLPMPTMSEMPMRDGRNRLLSRKQREERLDQTKRSRARALLLVIKAKIESVESGIETIEQAFLANVVMSNGETVYDRISQPIAIEYQTGRPDHVAGLLGGPQV